jgi:hypothetical protein
MSENLPTEHFDVLRNSSRLWRREAYDYLKKVLTVGLSLRDGEGLEALEAAANTTFLPRCEPIPCKELE